MSTVYQGGVLRFTAAAGPGLGRRCGFGATPSQATRVAVSASVARSHPTSSCHRTREPQERRITERPDRAWALVADSHVPHPRAHRLDDVAVLVEHQVRLVEPGPTTTRPACTNLDLTGPKVTPAMGSSGMARVRQTPRRSPVRNSTTGLPRRRPRGRPTRDGADNSPGSLRAPCTWDVCVGQPTSRICVG